MNETGISIYLITSNWHCKTIPFFYPLQNTCKSVSDDDYHIS